LLAYIAANVVQNMAFTPVFGFNPVSLLIIECVLDLQGGQVMAVLFSALIGGMSLGQAAPNISSFQEGRIAGARIWKVLDRCDQAVLGSRRNVPLFPCHLLGLLVAG
jgi:hypothetical protein